ncbi:MAG: transporter substrate-binding domain-containing protein [Alphaproteobacteria bacterium]|nr:transporter substrate-binding domain-containing protein [Alphaproteobacteria bacterium]
MMILWRENRKILFSSSVIRHYILLCFSYLFLISSVNSVQALEVAIDYDFAPYTLVNERGKGEGLFAEILIRALKLKNITPNISGVPWKRIVALTDSNQIDASIPWRAKEERFEKYHMIGPLLKVGSKTVLWTKKNSIASLRNKLEDLKGFRIGIIEGYAYPEVFEKATYLNKVPYVLENDDMLRILYRGRVDIIIGDEFVLSAAALEMGLKDKFEQVGTHLDVVDRYIAVPRSREDVATLLADALSAYQDTPDYDQLIRSYLGDSR